MARPAGRAPTIGGFMAKKQKKPEDDRKFVARNKKAWHRYEVVAKIEAGISLRGTEVKSLRAGGVALADAFGRFRKHELFLLNLHIAAYEKAAYGNHEPTRPRKLLLRKRELRKLRAKVEERGFTIVPLSIYFRRGLAKVELGLCRGKRTHDRRDDIRRRDEERSLRQQYR